MKFLVDAQLPRSLARWLNDAGYIAIHTLDLPFGNRTADNEINEIALRESYVVMTKDADFVNSHLLSRRPPKLLLIATGNIRNAELMTLLAMNIGRIADAFSEFDFIEINRDSVIFHS